MVRFETQWPGAEPSAVLYCRHSPKDTQMNKLLFALLAGIAIASVTVTVPSQAVAAGENPAPVGTPTTDRTVPGTGTLRSDPDTATNGTTSAAGAGTVNNDRTVPGTGTLGSDQAAVSHGTSSATGAGTQQTDRTVPGTGTLGSDPASATNGTTSAAGAGTGVDRPQPGERSGTLGSDPATATDGTSSAAGAGTAGRDLKSPRNPTSVRKAR